MKKQEKYKVNTLNWIVYFYTERYIQRTKQTYFAVHYGHSSVAEFCIGHRAWISDKQTMRDGVFYTASHEKTGCEESMDNDTDRSRVDSLHNTSHR